MQNNDLYDHFTETRSWLVTGLNVALISTVHTRDGDASGGENFKGRFRFHQLVGDAWV